MFVQSNEGVCTKQSKFKKQISKEKLFTSVDFSKFGIIFVQSLSWSLLLFSRGPNDALAPDSLPVIG